MSVSQPMSRVLIIIGLAVAAIGFIWPWLARLGLGRLPGDFWVQRDGFTFYAPIMTSILVSLVLSLLSGSSRDDAQAAARGRISTITYYICV